MYRKISDSRVPPYPLHSLPITHNSLAVLLLSAISMALHVRQTSTDRSIDAHTSTHLSLSLSMHIYIYAHIHITYAHTQTNTYAHNCTHAIHCVRVCFRLVVLVQPFHVASSIADVTFYASRRSICYTQAGAATYAHNMLHASTKTKSGNFYTIHHGIMIPPTEVSKKSSRYKAVDPKFQPSERCRPASEPHLLAFWAKNLFKEFLGLVLVGRSDV